MRDRTQRIVSMIFTGHFFGIIVAGCLAGCSVTEEKISLWKDTQKGPQKIADVITDSSQTTALRGAATVALVEIKAHALLTQAFHDLSASDADEVIQAAVPTLRKQIRTESADATDLSSTQIAAINGVYVLYPFAGAKSKPVVENELITWCTEGNFRTRERAGFNIRVIMKKVGQPAYLALVNRLDVTEPSIDTIAGILRDSEDNAVLLNASSKIAQSLGKNLNKITKSHLTAAAVIGGAKVADVLMAIVVNHQLSTELRNSALFYYSVALEKNHISAGSTHAQQLVAVAEDPTLDKRFREETYLTLAQIKSSVSTNSFTKLLGEEDFFWRLTGVRCLLRLDGDSQLEHILQSPKIVTDSAELTELVALLARFPKLKKSLIAALENSNKFGLGVIIDALALMGTREDIVHLEKLKDNSGKLPAIFSGKTVGTAASDAILAIEKKG